jgi:polyhydroxyalkanoate synthase
MSTEQNPYDPAEVTRAFQHMWLDAVRNPARALATYNDFVQQYTQIMVSASLAYWGRGQRQNEPVITPEKGDKRFSAPDWQQNPSSMPSNRATC